MNKPNFTRFILLLLALAIFTSFSFAQQPTNDPEQVKQDTEIVNEKPVSENDPLPFLKTEQSLENSEPTTGKLLFKTFGALILIIGLIFFGAWSLKKLGFGGKKTNSLDNIPELAVLTKVSIEKNQTLAVIKFGEKILLVGATPQNFTLLADESKTKSVSVKSRSVAELLAEENNSFANEFDYAQSRLNLLENEGELV